MRATILMVFLAMLLAGCGGGSSGANGSNPFDGNTDPVVALSVELRDSNCSAVSGNSFPANQDICVQATLTSDGTADADEVISFALSSNIGELTTSTALTNSQGVAQIFISNPNLTTGATTITATFGSATDSASFEYIAVDETPTPASIQLLLVNESSVVSRFTSNDEPNLVATVLDPSGQPLNNTIVTFSLNSSGPSLSPLTALTDSNGIAEASIQATDANIGAYTATASFTYESVDYSASYNFEIEPSDAQPGEVVLQLGALDSQCNAVSPPSFNANEGICVQATLTSDGEPLNAELIAFSLSSQLGQLSASTKLTENGIAEVSLSNPNLDVGAGTITATYLDTSATTNYEYLAVPTSIQDVPEVTLSMFLSGQQVSRFRTDEEVQIQARVLDAEDDPIADAIVLFSVQGSGPSLSPTTALTNASGIAQVTMTATEGDLGAYSLTAQVTVDSFSFSNSLNFEVQGAGTIIDDSQTRFGHINSDGDFVEGEIGSTAEVNGEVTISAGATVGFNVALVDENDQRLQTPTPVTFSSNCVANSQATIDQNVTTINGIASATFEDISCAGSTGNLDQIVASVVVNNETLTITRELNILPENAGSISFVSAIPDEIVLAGTGGQNSRSVSTLTFQLNGELGNPLAQQEVNFELNTSIGGMTLNPASGLTNSLGQVSTRVTAGTVPTAVRVTASASTVDGGTIQTQSDLLSVNTGLPDQNSFSLAASNFNPEANSIDGQEVVIAVRLADSFNNPVPNGTTVNFTTEGGTIEPSCLTGEDANGDIDPNADNTGTCTVTWTSSNPRVEDHRITILATAIGHETLFDGNGNNAYDGEAIDGGPIIDNTDSGFGISSYTTSGFIDHSEAWRDDNENGVRDDDQDGNPNTGTNITEVFLDYNGDGAFSDADGLFNGPQCNDEESCGQGIAASIHVRKSLVMVMSSSNALWRAYIGIGEEADESNLEHIYFSNDEALKTEIEGMDFGEVGPEDDISFPRSISIPEGSYVSVKLVFYDSANQILPSGTQLGLLDSEGNFAEVLATVNNGITIKDPTFPGTLEFLGEFTNSASESGNQVIQLAIDAPSGTRTNVAFTIGRE